MRFRFTVTGEYDAPDDPQERINIYGTDDPAEMAKIDEQNDPVSFIQIGDSNLTLKVEVIENE